MFTLNSDCGTHPVRARVRSILRRLFLLGAWLLAGSGEAAPPAPAIPQEILSDRFTMTVNGQPVPVAHAAAKYATASFDLTEPAEIAITAPTDDFWSSGVEVQPWRHGLRPARQGRTITFTLTQPAQLSISRPGDHRGDSEMFFLFANKPETDAIRPGAPGVRYYGPGVYREDISLKSGETLYLAAGAVVFGSLNIWDAENVRILGRGMVIHDGPQNPDTDEGWQHRPNWHGITMHNARQVVVRGITCIVRSRTWMIQMEGCRDILFEDIKVIGGTPNNANQDGIDWLGCGDTVVRDSFFRCADDIFALYGNTGFYDAAISIPGLDVRNILIERCVLSTSISNIVRVGWPGKVFNSGNFTLRDCDVIHMGPGGCIVPFALAEIWGEPGSKGTHTDYLFEDIRLESWHSLAQLRQPVREAGIDRVVFRNIRALEQPPLVPSVVLGNVTGVSFENIRIGDRMVTDEGNLPLERSSPTPTEFVPSAGPRAAFVYSPGAITPGTEVTFDASASATAGAPVTCEWSFGDGTTQQGAVVRHTFPDAQGTLLDGSGRFRVMLKVTDARGRTDAVVRPVVVTTTLQEPEKSAPTQAGLTYRFYEGTWSGLPDFSALKSLTSGTVEKVDLAVRQAEDNYGLVFEGFLRVPADGGYTFILTGKDGGRLEIGSTVVAESPAPRAQPCNTAGNTPQSVRASLGLQAGWHRFRLTMTDTLGLDAFALHWQGPGLTLSELTAADFARE